MRIFIIITLIGLFASCRKNICSGVTTHEFQVPVELFPMKDTLELSDTISISINFEHELLDSTTNRRFVFENFKFFPTLFIRKMDEDSIRLDVANNFDYIVEQDFEFSIFYYSDGQNDLNGSYKYENGEYALEYKLVPKVKGLYMLYHVNILDLDPDQTFPGMCSNAGTNINSQLNGGGSNNIEMLSHANDQEWTNWILVKPYIRFHRFGGYCFYVN